jgi:hypothetical protein
MKQTSTEMVASIRNIRDRLTGEKIKLHVPGKAEMKELKKFGSGRGGS